MKSYKFKDGPKSKDIDSPAPGGKGAGAQADYGNPNEGGEEPSEEPSEYPDHEVKDAYDTLKKAEEIKKKPKLMSHVAKHAEGHKAAISSIAGLRKAREKLNSGEPDADDEA